MTDISYLVISDIHLGHKRNQTTDILHNLDNFFDFYSDTCSYKDLDIIFIAGDMFDSLLDFSGTEIHEIIVWLDKLMRFCGKHKIKLRVLEGTPSHDWKQSKIVDTMHNMMYFFTSADIKYIDTLYIEHIKDLELYILYVPDEWNSSSETTLQQVKELMNDKGITSVDIAIMHGCFNYQVTWGNNVKVSYAHDEASYLSIVKYYISIGHIHTHSVHDRIIAQGSFDRIAHGEEEPKGAVLLKIGREPSYMLIENKLARTFKTIELKSLDLDKSMATIDRVVSKLREKSYVRIKASKTHPVFVALEDVKNKYPMYTFSKLGIDEEERVSYIQPYFSTENYTPISLTPDNLLEMLTTEIRNKYTLTDSQHLLLNSILENTK